MSAVARVAMLPRNPTKQREVSRPYLPVLIERYFASLHEGWLARSRHWPSVLAVARQQWRRL